MPRAVVVAADELLAPPADPRRVAWLIATIVLTVAPFAAAIAFAPSSGTRSGATLGWLLFVGSSMHVAASGWFYSVPEIRRHMRDHRTRYALAPAALVVGLAVVAAALTARQLQWVLVVYFGWQFFHFQKQNLGVAALGASALGLLPLTITERRALTGAGIGGIAALIGHPQLLQLVGLRAQDWLFYFGATVLGIGIITGVWAISKRQVRPVTFTVLFLAGLLFFVPVLICSSPFAAVAGLTIAHGLQYLLLVGLLAGASDQRQSAWVSLSVLLAVSLVLGILLNRASHLHTSEPAVRALYGAYLGLVCAHFVIDAGLWRLRDQFPREFLTRRLPYLLAQPPGNV
jgi:hypothetical protein